MSVPPHWLVSGVPESRIPAGNTTSYDMPPIVDSTVWLRSVRRSSVGLPDAMAVGANSMLAPRPPDWAEAGAGNARANAVPSAAAIPASAVRSAGNARKGRREDIMGGRRPGACPADRRQYA